MYISRCCQKTTEQVDVSWS